ncbi:MAG: glycosyltransferase [Planctomycetota bacterium]
MQDGGAATGGPRRSARLGLDYTPGPGHAPGVGRYVRELVRALVRIEGAPELRLVEYGRAPRPMEGAPLALTGRGVRVAPRRVRVGVPRRWLGGPIPLLGSAVGRISGRGCAVFHRVEPQRPARLHVPHTLSVTELPPAGSSALNALGETARTAAAVVTFSETARARIASELGVALSRVHAVPVGTEHWWRDLGLHEPAPARPSRDVLVLGAVREARMPLAALRAFEALRERAPREPSRLLLVGRPGDAAAAFRSALGASPARDSVRWIEDPDEVRMPACVAGAATLLHFARDEVSPVTPLEARRMGLSVVASALPAFQEVLDGGARWVDPGDPAGVAEALGDALDEGVSAEARRAAERSARPFTWDACARAHLDVWRPML